MHQPPCYRVSRRYFSTGLFREALYRQHIAFQAYRRRFYMLHCSLLIVPLSYAHRANAALYLLMKAIIFLLNNTSLLRAHAPICWPKPPAYYRHETDAVIF